MSLSRLEKDAIEAEMNRVELLKAKALSKESDETKLRKKILEEEREHTRYCVKGAARCDGSQKVQLAHVLQLAPPRAAGSRADVPRRRVACCSVERQHLVLQGPRRRGSGAVHADDGPQGVGARRD